MPELSDDQMKMYLDIRETDPESAERYKQNVSQDVQQPNLATQKREFKYCNWCKAKYFCRHNVSSLLFAARKYCSKNCSNQAKVQGKIRRKPNRFLQKN